MATQCYKCKTKNRTSAKFCKACGATLKRSMSSGLENVIGRDKIKATLNRLIKSTKEYKKGWNGKIVFNKNMIITGNSGTGKTSLVESISNLFFNENIISKREPVIIDASEFEDFVSNIDKNFNKANDGVLFVDNFHKVLNNTVNNGYASVDKFFYKLDKTKTNPIVIISGLSEVINNYFFKNASANNYFEYNFSLHDFTSSELYNICKQRIEEVDLHLDEDSANKLSLLFKYKVKIKDSSFSNAHFALNIAEDLLLSYYHRVSLGANDDKIISTLDIIEKIPEQKTLDEIFKELDSYIGLTEIKTSLRDIARQIKNQQHLEAKGEKTNLKFGFHMILTGNPGTGKTMIARKIGEVLAAINYLDRGHVVEVDQSKLVGKFIGETPQLVQKHCDAAMGGVLFIDEAYALAPRAGNKNQFGQEAIDTLLKRMEDDRDKFVVIVAGYENEMQHFINSNSGLESRFDNHIHLPDYNPIELTDIFKFFLKKSSYSLSHNANIVLPDVIHELYKKRKKIFGNGREVRKLFESTIINLSKRVSNIEHNKQSLEVITQIEPEDFPYKKEKIENLDDIFNELNSLVGLENIKTDLEKLVAYIKVNQKRKELGGKTNKINNHFVFKGNPGTGKTTVARIVAKIFKALGVLPKGHLIEVDRSGLVAEFVGQTAVKTDEVINTALGGVLFIDEAYSLAVEDRKGDFGNEAIQKLLKRMEDDADKFIVIVAGYPNEMNDFINSNPGLKSRFKKHIEFIDYNPKELLKIFKLMIKNAGLKLSIPAVEKATSILENIYNNRDSNFGNGRTVRNLFDATLENQSYRISKILNDPNFEKETLYTIEDEDIKL